MPTKPPNRRAWLGRAVVACGIAGAGLALLLPGLGAFEQARAGEVLRANSVCEAQELKAAKQSNPQLEIEIPAEFDRDFPSLGACRSHDAAWDEEAPGPNQPIPFSHAHHAGQLAGQFEISCLYCHAGTDRSQAAGVPSVELCMGCHAQFPAAYDELEGIQILKQHWTDMTAIPWVQIHRLPEHVQFRHNRHASEYAESLGINCQTCHGPVEQMDKLYLVPDTAWGPVAIVPAQKLEMGWCINCHRENGVSQDCLTCHY